MLNKCKALNMEVDQTVVDERTETEWTSFFQNALQSDPKLGYNETNPCYTYSVNGIDFEVTEQEQQRYLAFLSQIPDVYNRLSYWPSSKQKLLALALAAYVSRNEKNFVQLNSNGTYKALIEMAEISKPATTCLVKIRYLDMLCSFFEHEAGVRWSLETNYWTKMYDLIAECQQISYCIAQKVYCILSKFLQKTSNQAPKVCIHVIKQMIQTLIEVSSRNVPKTKTQPMELIDPKDYNNLLPSITCLVETLERLLSSPGTDTLKYFIKMQVREATDTLAILSKDTEFSLQVNRILIILSFYEMTELFDGIKVVNHDPIALSGFLKIIERELKKSHLKTIFELYYYAQKYWKNVSRIMPQYFLKGKVVNIEDELMSFQVEPIIIIAEKLLGVPQTSEEELRHCYLADILNMSSANSVSLAYEIREQLTKEPLDIEITALNCLIKSKPLYCRKNLAVVFQALTYSLRDFIKYMKKNPDKGELDHDHLLAEALLEAILAYLENFDLSWRESIGSIELAHLVYEFLCYSARWPSEVVLKSLKTLNITISKHMSPYMALLVDTTQYSYLNDLGSMLFNKSLNSNCEVRNAALTVVCTICQKVNKGFSSFKKILEETLSHDLIMSMALTDSDASVRATALKCLQQMLVMEDIGNTLFSYGFIDKILQLVSQEQEAIVIREAITLIGQIYQCDCNSEEANRKIYKVMVKVALRENNYDVQEQAVKFWDQVTKKLLEKQGMSDDVFPSVIFSKEHKKIIRLNDKEIRKRLFQALDGMSKSGCFSVFHCILRNENTPKQVFGTTVAIVTKLLRLLQQYEVTPEFILFNQTYPNLWSIPGNIIQSPTNNMDDENMQDIIEETVMEMINSSTVDRISACHTPLSCKHLETRESGLDQNTESGLGQVTAVDFIDFIYRKLPYLIN
ncbi:uncharacterized protein LOC109533940 isoform X1 [Dendroctonus ponderosae]|uniref:uncharacterized protein LOC109533940 isoform X1 n=1 Tax=Dendroctonus ponderosae TaxID=77166 RepID=UPI002034EAA5|nr:uncharacterized protein LOC109533940 isoform X1 [Dendroctonus ponderosae]XP_048516564.1 uncharacterized protein LOC109533940 isoform X1 [Dendroctonus ponderosae]